MVVKTGVIVVVKKKTCVIVMKKTGSFSYKWNHCRRHGQLEELFWS